MSLSLALAARYKARRVDQLQTPLDRYASYWLVLAKTAPKLVAIDLVLAELYAAGDFAKDRPEYKQSEEEDSE